MASFRCGRMSEIRELRQSIGLSQQECAARLDVSVETFRAWDSGRRVVPRALFTAQGKASLSTNGGRSCCPEPTRRRTRCPRAHLAGCCPHGSARRHVLREVRVRPTAAGGLARCGREVHPDSLSSVRRPAGLRASSPLSTTRLRCPAEKPSLSAETQSTGSSATHWRCREGRGLPVGI